jgi:hypothetical protein
MLRTYQPNRLRAQCRLQQMNNNESGGDRIGLSFGVLPPTCATLQQTDERRHGRIALAFEIQKIGRCQPQGGGGGGGGGKRMHTRLRLSQTNKQTKKTENKYVSDSHGDGNASASCKSNSFKLIVRFKRKDCHTAPTERKAKLTIAHRLRNNEIAIVGEHRRHAIVALRRSRNRRCRATGCSSAWRSRRRGWRCRRRCGNALFSEPLRGVGHDVK